MQIMRCSIILNYRHKILFNPFLAQWKYSKFVKKNMVKRNYEHFYFQIDYIFIFTLIVLGAQIDDLKYGLKSGKYVHKKIKKGWSPVWQKFHGIYEKNSDIQIENFFYCIECGAIEFNGATGKNTNRLLRHICTTEASDQNNNSITTMLVAQSDKDKLKLASVKFIVKVDA